MTQTITEQQVLDYVAQLSSADLRKFQESIGVERWTKQYGFPLTMFKWFQEGISKHRGDDWENEYIASCTHLSNKRDGAHDAILDSAIVQNNNLKGDEIEVKFFTVMANDSKKMITKRGYALTWAERASNIVIDNNQVRPPKKGTWQQVKPACAHYGLFSALYGNGALHYWVPYHLLSTTPGAKNATPGRIPMGIQHKNHNTEGQVDIRSRFHELFFLDATIGTPFITDLSKYDLSKYENLVY